LNLLDPLSPALGASLDPLCTTFGPLRTRALALVRRRGLTRAAVAPARRVAILRQHRDGECAREQHRDHQFAHLELPTKTRPR